MDRDKARAGKDLSWAGPQGEGWVRRYLLLTAWWGRGQGHSGACPLGQGDGDIEAMPFGPLDMGVPCLGNECSGSGRVLQAGRLRLGCLTRENVPRLLWGLQLLSSQRLHLPEIYS